MVGDDRDGIGSGPEMTALPDRLARLLGPTGSAAKAVRPVDPPQIATLLDSAEFASATAQLASSLSRAASHLRCAMSMGARSAARTSGRSVQRVTPSFSVTLNNSGYWFCSATVSTPSSQSMNE